jgi:hypothetical protein
VDTAAITQRLHDYLLGVGQRILPNASMPQALDLGTPRQAHVLRDLTRLRGRHPERRTGSAGHFVRSFPTPGLG